MTRGDMAFFFRAVNGPKDWAWINNRVPLVLAEDMIGVMAVDVRKPVGVLAGAVVLDNWVENSVQAHMVVDNPLVLRHGFLEFVSDFVFNHQGKSIIYGFVPSDNEKALKLNRHIGFRELIRLQDTYYPGVGAVIMEMRKENCRFLRQKTTRTAPAVAERTAWQD